MTPLPRHYRDGAHRAVFDRNVKVVAKPPNNSMQRPALRAAADAGRYPDTVMRRHSILEKPSSGRREDFLAAVTRSRKLHGRWASPPSTPEAFDTYLKLLRGDTHVSYWVCTEASELAGVFNISEIVRGAFRSAYLGYYAFVPHNGQGYMSRGLRSVLSEVFGPQRLHRLEANIQPENDESRRLVQGVGFRLEGFSPRYLKIAGRWRDHERWAITAEEWRARFLKSRITSA